MIVEELNNEEISDEWEMSDALSEELTEFCMALEKEDGMTRPVNEEDGADNNCHFMWTSKAQKLIDSEINRLQVIAQKYYPDGVDISSHMYREE